MNIWLQNNSSFLLFQSPDGKYIACGAIDGIVNIFDMATKKLLHTLEGKVVLLKCFLYSLCWKFFSITSKRPN